MSIVQTIPTSRCPRTRMVRAAQASILVAVLAMLVVLEGLLLGFATTASRNLHAGAEECYLRQARHCADAGVNLAVAALQGARDPRTEALRRRLFDDGLRTHVGEGSCEVRVTDESGKLNVNALALREGGYSPRRVAMLLRLIDVLNARYYRRNAISYSLAPAIVDWTDADNETTVLPFVQRENQGAETPYYAALPTPRACRNAPLADPGELLLVRGMTPEIFHGRPGGTASTNRPVPGMRDFLTVYGGESIDVNAAPAEVIESLSERMDAGLARSIVRERRSLPFRRVQDVRQTPGMTDDLFAEIEPLIAVKRATRYYRVIAIGRVRDVSMHVEQVVRFETETRRATMVARGESQRALHGTARNRH